MSPGSREAEWIAADLAAHPTFCTLAFMHYPRFSSGPHSKQRSAVAVFRLLGRAGVDVLDVGILKLTLHPRGYAWEFVPAARSEYHDAGSGTCH